MKRIATVLTLTALLSASANAADESKKGPYYQAVSSMSSNSAVYTFLLDELLTERCGAEPSINHLKMAVDSEIVVLMALKDGKVANAKATLLAIPCEEASK